FDKKGKQLATVKMPDPVKGIADTIWVIPDLKEYTQKSGNSEYELVFDIQGIKDGKIKKSFLRNVMEWEGNKLGKSDLIVPPFTAIEVKDKTVATILRKHEMNSLGLWKQVYAAGRPLLKNEGIVLEAKVGGKDTKIASGKLEFSKKTKTEVIANGSFTAGALKGSTLSEWDYDGMMKWTLTLSPSQTEIDSLKLIVPLDDSQSPLFHTCTDGIRINYGGAAPKGTGKVWDGSACARNTMQGNYVPYIWCGDELRGISVFGENDKGWEISDKVPCQELIRKDGVLSLVFNLIAKSVAIEKERKIVIGFLATPIKPMPENWRKWNAWSWYGNSVIKQFEKRVQFFGSCYYWGSDAPCLDIYPRDKDITYWEKLAETRRTGEIDKDFIKKWVSGYKLSGKPGSDRYKKSKKVYQSHVNGGFNNAKSARVDNKSVDVMFYTNARGVRWDTPEGGTFVDEWYRMPFIQRSFKHKAGVAYDLDPVESFRDYAMWWYKKSFNTGANDLLYWDDIFMQSNYNLVGSEAYRKADGTIQTASGIFNMRELVRRTAILQLEEGKPVRNMVHMTNTALAPISSFASMNYDWEGHNGYSDFQDRYTPEYIRTLTIGHQFGVFPVVLAPVSGGTKEQLDWCYRTATGVMLTHELRWTKHSKQYWSTLKHFYDFGYGNSDVNVFNYWKENYPLKVAGIKSTSIVLAKKDSAFIMVCEYGEGGDAVITPDWKALGLSPSSKVVDAETGKEVANDNGTIKTNLKKHDFQIFVLSEQ
ncbi:MAG: glycoside hydrolase domain-containing protein, partial [Planctomycetota bacterium]